MSRFDFGRAAGRAASALGLGPWRASRAAAQAEQEREALLPQWREVLREGAQAATAMIERHGAWLANAGTPNGFGGRNAPLVIAAGHADAALWRALVVHGADPRGLGSDGETTLMAAAALPCEEIMRLAAKHCDPKAVNRQGDTALICAARASGVPVTLEADQREPRGDAINLETARWLVRASDALAVNSQGLSAMDLVADSRVPQPWLAQALAEKIDPARDCSGHYSKQARSMGERSSEDSTSPLARAIRAESWPVVDAFLLSPLLGKARREAWLKMLRAYGVHEHLPRAVAADEDKILAEAERRALVAELEPERDALLSEAEQAQAMAMGKANTDRGVGAKRL
jgi:hypothetical protein